MKPFEGLFGNTCELRIIEYLLPLDGIEFNLTELAEEVGVSRPSATKAVKKFAEWGLINVRSERNLTYYSINPDSPIAKNIIQLNNLLIEKMLGEETLYQIHENLESKKALVESTAAPSFMEKELKPSNSADTYLDKILKQSIWCQEPSSYTCQEAFCCNESTSIYSSEATA